jgi:DNA-binding transcriptional ArsR family regulator
MPKPRARTGLAATAVIFAALGDPTRLALVERLARDGPASISLLADRFDLTRQGVTKHLYVLAGAGLVDGRRSGREHIWALKPARLADARRHLDLVARGWDDALARLKRHVEG